MMVGGRAGHPAIPGQKGKLHAVAPLPRPAAGPQLPPAETDSRLDFSGIMEQMPSGTLRFRMDSRDVASAFRPQWVLFYFSI